MNHAGDNATIGSSQLPSEANWRVYSEKFDDDGTTVVKATEPGGNGGTLRRGSGSRRRRRSDRPADPTFQLNISSTWTVVLAAGEGSRLRSLTTIAPGVSIPKQFCSLRPGPSLLDQTLTRAIAVSGRKRTCAIVSADHRRWWEPLPWRIPAQNIVVQHLNRGTATGILLPLLQILDRDPDASVVFLPSDHFVQREMVLQRSMQRAVQRSRRDRDSIILLGFDPDTPDTQLGYIVPNGNPVDDVANVERFF